jgi:hypothetical protein
VQIALNVRVPTKTMIVEDVRIGQIAGLTARVTNENGVLVVEVGEDKKYVRLVVDKDESVKVEQIDGIERRFLQTDAAGALRFLTDKPYGWTGRQFASLSTGLGKLLGRDERIKGGK